MNCAITWELETILWDEKICSGLTTLHHGACINTDRKDALVSRVRQTDSQGYVAATCETVKVANIP